MGAALPARHQRAVVGLAIVAALVAAATVWSAMAGTREPHRSASRPDASGPPPSAESPDPVAKVPRHLRRWLEVESGSLLPGPRAGVTVLDRVDDPVGSHADGSIAFSLARGRGERWVLVALRDGETRAFMDHPRLSRWLTFDQWLTDLVLQERGASGLELAVVGDDGAMTAVADGAEVLDQAVDVDHRMGAFRERRDSVFAVALVRWQGERWFVMSERYDGASRPTAIAARRTGTTATTAEEFIAQYSELGKRP